jgi:hypothetical protein
VRRQRLGYPEEPLSVAHRPAAWWLALFLLSYREAGGAWERIAWPDGGPLLAQSWLAVTLFEVIADECRRIALEEARAARRRGRG